MEETTAKKKKMKKPVKVILTILLVIVLIIALLCATCGIYYGASRVCDLTITIDEDDEQQEFYGWGTSDCWWADDIEDEETRAEIASLLYGEDGLDINIYRYCLYGGYDPDNNRVDNEWRLGESFLVYDEETDSYVYDWDQNANATAMLYAALDEGVDTVVFFANSPHYSMCINGQSSGSDSGDYVSNLDESRYQDYVDYFLDITEHFIDEGVPVKYISPINEPQWAWGGDYVSQEGCHYDEDEVVALLKLFAQSIIERGLDVQLYIPESANIGDTTKRYYESLMADEDIAAVAGVFSYHSYFSDNDQTKKSNFGDWIEESVDIRVDMSEWCELPTTGDASDVERALIIARVIAQDVGLTGVNSWSNWVAENQTGVSEDDGLDYSDGLLVTNTEDETDYYISARYYGYQQFSKFVPSGSVVLDCGDGVYTVSVGKDTDDNYCLCELVNEVAFKTPDGDIVLVVVNEGNTRDISVKLDGYTSVSVYTTDEDHNCEETYSGEALDEYEIGADSINTYVFSK